MSNQQNNFLEKLSIPCPKKWRSPLNPSFKDFIIDNYIGEEIYRKASKRVRFNIMYSAIRQWEQETITKYGSRYKFYLAQAKSWGYNSLGELYEERVRRRGFKDMKDYKKWLCKNNKVKYFYHISLRRSNPELFTEENHIFVLKPLSERESVKKIIFFNSKNVHNILGVKNGKKS